MNKRGLLLVISGPSGAGKGTICKALVEKHKELYVSVSATTRQPRVGEIDGVNYHFTTKRTIYRKNRTKWFPRICRSIWKLLWNT